MKQTVGVERKVRVLWTYAIREGFLQETSLAPPSLLLKSPKTKSVENLDFLSRGSLPLASAKALVYQVLD